MPVMRISSATIHLFTKSLKICSKHIRTLKIQLPIPCTTPLINRPIMTDYSNPNISSNLVTHVKLMKFFNQVILNPWTELLCVIVFCWCIGFCTLIHWCPCGHLAHNESIWYFVSDVIGVLATPLLLTVYIGRQRTSIRIAMILLLTLNAITPMLLIATFKTHLSSYIGGSALNNAFVIFIFVSVLTSIAQIFIAAKRIKQMKRSNKSKHPRLY